MRLTTIKCKKVTAEVFQNFYIDKTSCEQPENLVQPSGGEKGDKDSASGSFSSEEGDNTDDDEDYIPDPDDLGGDPDGAQVKKTKAEGTYMSAMYNRYYHHYYCVSMLVLASCKFQILLAILFFYEYRNCCLQIIIHSEYCAHNQAIE